MGYSATSFFNQFAYEIIKEGVAEVIANGDFVGLDEYVVVIKRCYLLGVYDIGFVDTGQNGGDGFQGHFCYDTLGVSIDDHTYLLKSSLN